MDHLPVLYKRFIVDNVFTNSVDLLLLMRIILTSNIPALFPEISFIRLLRVWLAQKLQPEKLTSTCHLQKIASKQNPVYGSATHTHTQIYICTHIHNCRKGVHVV